MQTVCVESSVPVAIAASSALGTLFVACLYIRTGKVLPNRDDPQVVKQRFGRVGVASAIAPVITFSGGMLGGGGPECAPRADIARWVGLWSPAFLQAFVLPLALTMLLFLGPLVMEWLDSDRSTPLRNRIATSQVAAQWCDPRGRLLLVRNLVVGPLAEEWVFRACMCPLLFGAGLTDAANVFTSAFIFGAAHIHHRFDSGVNWLAVAVQFTYTSLFGAYSSYLFLRTGLLVGPLAAHVFCNFMGLPDFGGVTTHPNARLVGGAFVLGLGGFIAAVTADAVVRPALFSSLFWTESEAPYTRD